MVSTRAKCPRGFVQVDVSEHWRVHDFIDFCFRQRMFTFFFLQERVHGTCSKRLLWNLIRLKSVGFRSATECCLCKACTELKKDWAAAVDLLTNEHTAMVQSELDVHIKVDNWILFSMWIRPSPSSAPWRFQSLGEELWYQILISLNEVGSLRNCKWHFEKSLLTA